MAEEQIQTQVQPQGQPTEQKEKTQEELAKEAAEKKADLDSRVKGFNEELSNLLGKYNLGLTGQPMFTPDGRVLARAVVVDDTRSEEQKKAASGLEAA